MAMVLDLVLVFSPAVRADEGCWTRRFGAPGSVITDLAVDKAGLWAAGRVTDGEASPGLWTGLLDQKGRLIWQLRLPPRGHQLYPRLAPSRLGHWIVAGTYRPLVPAPGGGSLTASQIWLGEVSRAGKLVRSLQLAPHRVTTIQAVSGLGDGGILLAGLVERGTDLYSQGWVARLDARGRLMWERLLPQVSWLVALEEMEPGRWLLAGQVHGEQEGDQRPWLATVDAQGRIQPPPQPAIPGLTLYAALPAPDAWWLAGEWSPPRSGARLIRVDRTGGKLREYPVPGFSVLRLLARMPHALLAGGDGLGEAPPDVREGNPGWVALAQRPFQGLHAEETAPMVQRVAGLPQGELRAWAWFPTRSGQTLVGAGADPYRGAWIGCMK